MALEKND